MNKKRDFSAEIFGEGLEYESAYQKDLYESLCLMFLAERKPKEAELLALYFGWDNGQVKTYKEVGKLIPNDTTGETGITPETTRRLMCRALRVLRYRPLQRFLLKKLDIKYEHYY